MVTKRSIETLGEVDLRGKKVFVRAYLNVPLDDAQKITDDTCIRASVPTIKFLLRNGTKVILATHLGLNEMDTQQMHQLCSLPVSDQLGIQLFTCIARRSRDQLFGLVNLMAWWGGLKDH
ncbi:hypothetical protein ABZP36_007897 [Zizania latifolia]